MAVRKSLAFMAVSLVPLLRLTDGYRLDHRMLTSKAHLDATAISKVGARPFDPESCTLWIQSNPWDSCRHFIDRYRLELSDFYDLNPSVDTDCYRFVPGATYCISAVYSHIISTDGSCGLNVTGIPITCVGSEFGQCCGSEGRCGSTAAYCGIGNCQFGDCEEAGYTFDGRCGAQFYGLECGGSWGNCCSNDGVCGSTSAECGAGNCQSGACAGGGDVSSTITETGPPLSTPTSGPPTPYLPSPDGTCGYTNKYKCTDTLLYFGNCCSAAGFCSWTSDECRDDLGCQSEYGLCDSYITVTVTAGGTRTSSSNAIPTSSA